MVKINTERCNGCGECMKVCPTGAIYLVEGKAVVEQELCRNCQSCIAACPTEAISPITPQRAVVEQVRVPAVRPEPQVIQIKTGLAPAPLRTSVLPVAGGALAWAGREIVPQLAEYLLNDLDRWLTRKEARSARQSTPDSASSIRGGRGRRRRRRRGG